MVTSNDESNDFPVAFATLCVIENSWFRFIVIEKVYFTIQLELSNFKLDYCINLFNTTFWLKIYS